MRWFALAMKRLRKIFNQLRYTITSPLGGPAEINIVLSHPKTGGNTLESAVSMLRPRSRVYFAHYTKITPPSVASAGLQARLPSLGLSRRDLGARKLHRQVARNMQGAARAAEAARSVISAAKSAGSPRLNIISAVREPVACYLSGYFQVLGDTGFRDIPTERVAEDIAKMIRQTAPVNQLLWWNREIRDFFGFDILAQDFDYSRGWQKYDLESCRLLVVRQENFETLTDILASFFDTPTRPLGRLKKNAAEDKGALAPDYAEKIKKCVFQSDLLDQVYGNPWFRKFYSEEEENIFRRRWAAV